MADVTIESSLDVPPQLLAARHIVWTSALVGYAFFVSSALAGISYSKTTDGGATWGARVSIDGDAGVVCFDVWYDRWTPGNSGSRVHIVFLNAATNTVRFRYLDTATDTVGANVTVATPASIQAGDACLVSIAKMHGGNLLITYMTLTDALAFASGFHRSVDNGLNWTSRTDPAEGDRFDRFVLFPGNGADNQDAWLAFWDDSADELSLKTYDDSANSWSEASISTGIDLSGANFTSGYSGSIRHSDRHLLFAAWNLPDAATSDLLTWDINGAGSIVAKTNVHTNVDNCIGVSLFINQITDEVYATYIGKGDASQAAGARGVYYKKSTDGMATWGAEQTLAETLDTIIRVSTGLGTSSGRFEPVWVNDDLDDLVTNFLNSIAINPTPSGAILVHVVGDIGGVGSASAPRISVDGGESWTDMTHPLTGEDVVAIERAPDGRWWALVAESAGTDEIVILYSDDEGSTWSESHRANQDGVWSLHCHPTDPNKIIAAAKDSGGTLQLYRTINRGSSWTKVTPTGVTTAGIYSEVRWLASGRIVLYEDEAAPGGMSIYISDNNGASFTSKFNHASHGGGRAAISVISGGPIFVLARGGSTPVPVLLRSLDQGDSFIRCGGDLPDGGVGVGDDHIGLAFDDGVDTLYLQQRQHCITWKLEQASTRDITAVVEGTWSEVARIQGVTIDADGHDVLVLMR